MRVPPAHSRRCCLAEPGEMDTDMSEIDHVAPEQFKINVLPNIFLCNTSHESVIFSYFWDSYF